MKAAEWSRPLWERWERLPAWAILSFQGRGGRREGGGHGKRTGSRRGERRQGQDADKDHEMDDAVRVHGEPPCGE